MSLRWFLSGKVRQISDLCAHVRKLRDAQADILSPHALDGLDTALQNTETVLQSNPNNDSLAKVGDELEKAANKWLKPYPNAEWRENIEVFLVAIVVAMAIRTFFLQPFKIPTSSMQPTLYGVTIDPLYDADFKMPGFLERVYDFVAEGAIYHEFIAPQDGSIVDFGRPETFLRFFHKQTVTVSYADGSTAPLTVWFAPNPDDANGQPLEQRIGPTQPFRFHKGEPILRFAETTGDHLFVDRMTYNFRHPQRGEIVVFKTRGIQHPMMNQSQFYIKRLIGLPGEAISIGDDRHVRVNGVRLDASTPRFSGVYSFDPKRAAADSHLLKDTNYNGHILQPGSYLEQPNNVMLVTTNHYFMMGDNTKTSFDSRYWGFVPQDNIMGRSFFVYWPIASHAPALSRFGWGQR